MEKVGIIASSARHGVSSLRPVRRLAAIISLSVLLALCHGFFASASSFAQDEASGRPAGSYVPPDNTLVVTAGTIRSWPPYYSVDKSGKPGGFAIEVMNEIAALANVEVIYTVYDSFPLAMSALEAKEVDLLPNVGIAAIREKFALFTDPVETFLVRVFVRSGTLAGQRRDADWREILKERRTAVVVANIAERILAEQGDMNIASYESVHEAVVDLIAGRVDALAYPDAVVNRITQSIGLSGKIEAVGTPLREIKRAVAVRNDYPELRNRLSTAVDYFVRTNKYEEIYTRWFGAQKPFWTLDHVGMFIGIPTGVLLIVLVGWRYYSVTALNRRLVENRASLAALNAELEHRDAERTKLMESADQALVDLQRSQESLNRAQGIAHIGNWDWDIANGTLAWSDEIYRIFGLQPQEFGATYEAFLEYIHPDDRDAVTAGVGACLEQRIPYSIEHRVVRPDGEERIVHEHGSVERDDTGAPIFMSGTVQDITERKKIEQALLDAHEKLEQKVEERTQELTIEKAKAEDYLNIAGTIILALDSDGSLVLINRKGREVLGYEKENLIGKNWFDLAIPEMQRDEVRAAFGKILNGELESVENYENHIVTRDGEERLISWHNTYLRDDQGIIRGVLTAGEDITESRRAEEALINSRKELLKAQAITGMGNWSWRVDGLEEVWSDQLFRIFGYEPGSVVPGHQMFMSAVHPDDLDNVLAALDSAVHENRPYSIDYRIVRPDGEVRYVAAQGEPTLDVDGGAKMMVGTVLDITERKAIEQKLVQSAKMATLGEMATGVAHELNQPLNVIRMAVSNIQRKIGKNAADPEYLNDKLDKVEQQIERAAAIIDHMRIFGRRADTYPSRLDPKVMVDSALGLIGEQLRLAGIEVHVDAPETSQAFLGHQVQVEQVLLNLLGNARDQLHNVKDQKQIAIAIGSDKKKVRISIEDTGGGIPDDVLPRIFEPFFTTKEIGAGTGLGLSISYGIITDMGGTIEAANTGHGARFTITLPACAADKSAA